MMRQHVDHDLARLSREARITVLRPPVNEQVGIGDFRHVEKLIARAERFGERLLRCCRDGAGYFLPGVVERPD